MVKPTEAMQLILDAHRQMSPLRLETMSAELARQMPLADRAALAVYGQHFMKRALLPLPLPVGRIEHRLVSGAEGDLLLRIYTPRGTMPVGGWPVVVYFHGGGWVVGTLDSYDASCRSLCDAAESIVVSAHYRQAPEHPWPAAAEDAFAAYHWVCANARLLDGCPRQISIAGESAGGNLAAVACLMARDRGVPLPQHQLLIYPVTDLAHGLYSPSAREHIDAQPLNWAMLSWFYEAYAPKGVDRGHPYLSPLHAESHGGLPTATIILAEIDPLRSDGEAYGEALKRAGVAVTTRMFAGVTHEFFGMKGLLDEAAEAVELAADDLRMACRNALERAAA